MRSTRAVSGDGVDNTEPLLLPENKLAKKCKYRKKKKPIPSLTKEVTNPLVDQTMQMQLLGPDLTAKDQSFIVIYEQDPPTEDTKANIRTIKMKRFLAECSAKYDTAQQVLTIDEKEYQIITSAFTDFVDHNKPLASVGSSQLREVIILDQQQSPLLMQKYGAYRSAIFKFCKQAQGSKVDATNFIELTNRFMQEHVFNATDNVSYKIDLLLARCKVDPSIPKIEMHDQLTLIPCIPIDVFIAARHGLCRHHSMVAAYLMDRFIRHHPKCCDFIGKVQIMRDNVGEVWGVGAHSWVTLVCKEGDKNNNYSIDTLNSYVGNLNDADFARLFTRSFGSHTTKHQHKKAEKLRSSIPSLV